MHVLLHVYNAEDHQGLTHAVLLSNIPSPLCISLHGHMCLWGFICVLECANTCSCTMHVTVHPPVCMCEHSCVPEHLCVIVCVHTYLSVPRYTCVFLCNKVSDLQRWPGSSVHIFQPVVRWGKLSPRAGLVLFSLWSGALHKACSCSSSRTCLGVLQESICLIGRPEAHCL